MQEIRANVQERLQTLKSTKQLNSSHGSDPIPAIRQQRKLLVRRLNCCLASACLTPQAVVRYVTLQTASRTCSAAARELDL